MKLETIEVGDRLVTDLATFMVKDIKYFKEARLAPFRITYNDVDYKIEGNESINGVWYTKEGAARFSFMGKKLDIIKIIKGDK